MHKQSITPDWLIKPVSPIELYVLIFLAKSRSYAYDISRSIRENLGGRVTVTSPGIRQALQRMHKQGWIQAADINQSGRNERAYQLTELGVAQLQAELIRLEGIIELGHHHLAIYEAHLPAQT